MFSDFLRNLLNPIIVVRADNGDLVFVSRKLEVREQPLIRVTDDHRILEYGRAAMRGEDGRLIRLLQGSPDPDALTVFCRYHLKMFVSADALRRRPQVVLEQAAIRREFGPDALEALRSAIASDGIQVDLAP